MGCQAKIADTLAVALEIHIDPLVFDGWRIHARVAESAARPTIGKGRAEAPSDRNRDDGRANEEDERALRLDQLQVDQQALQMTGTRCRAAC